MNYLPHQFPDELLYGEFHANQHKPKGILDYLTQPSKHNEDKGLLGNMPTSQDHQPTSLWECLGVEES